MCLTASPTATSPAPIVHTGRRMGLAAVGLLMVCGAVQMACGIYRVSATMPVLLVALFLLQAAVLHT